ncbi:MAG: hypothetical protein K0S45_2104 [Nitrospira sp.]|jgi:hypothetical protein|nr:hypothetical protein [Nitrospira sp.]
MTLRSPRGSSVYFIFSLIDPPAFPPVAGSENPNDAIAKRTTNGQDSDQAETVMPLLAWALRQVLCNHVAWISKGKLSQVTLQPAPHRQSY